MGMAAILVIYLDRLKTFRSPNPQRLQMKFSFNWPPCLKSVDDGHQQRTKIAYV